MGLFGFGKKKEKEVKKELTPEEEYEEKNKVPLGLIRSYGLDPYSFDTASRNNLVFLFQKVADEASVDPDHILNGTGYLDNIQDQGVIRNAIAVLNTAQNYKLQQSVNEQNNKLDDLINMLQDYLQKENQKETINDTSKEEKTLKIDSREPKATKETAKNTSTKQNNENIVDWVNKQGYFIEGKKCDRVVDAIEFCMDLDDDDPRKKEAYEKFPRDLGQGYDFDEVKPISSNNDEEEDER